MKNQELDQKKKDSIEHLKELLHEGRVSLQDLEKEFELLVAREKIESADPKS